MKLIVKKQTVRLQENTVQHLIELMGTKEFKSENECIEFAINSLHSQKLSSTNLLMASDKIETVLFNQISLMLRTQSEQIANAINKINHDQRVITVMLEMILHAMANVPTDSNQAQRKIKNSLQYFAVVEKILSSKNES